MYFNQRIKCSEKKLNKILKQINKEKLNCVSIVSEFFKIQNKRILNIDVVFLAYTCAYMYVFMLGNKAY